MIRVIAFLLILQISLAINPLLLIGLSDDKVMHSLGSYAITDIAERKDGLDWFDSFCLIGVVGLVKESLDVLCGGQWDDNDIAANYFGWAAFQIVHRIEL